MFKNVYIHPVYQNILLTSFLSGEEKIGGVDHLYKRMTKKEIKASQLGKEMDEEVRAEHTIL